MHSVILFGGTTEGRALAERLSALHISTLLCVATDYGEPLPGGSSGITLRVGRMGANAMRALFEEECPALVLDATHPYASEASRSIQAACAGLQLRYIRVLREETPAVGQVLRFSGLPPLVDWLNTTAGNIFVAMGAKHAEDFTKVQGFQERVHLRLLPAIEGLTFCLQLGFPASHLILMQGPFSRELNTAMFRGTGARILVTKESGAAGGYAEKIEAAQACGMQVAVLTRPMERGVSLHEAIALLEEMFA